MRRVRVRIGGRVQGVFFRASCADMARGLGLAGWARNLRDGGVEAVFEGRPDKVRQMLDWCRQGPPMAKVHSVEVIEEPVEGAQGFRITG
jgi:acylphosphatase